MKIEEEIKQKHFKNESQKSYINLLYTANWVEYGSRKFFDKFEITSQQYNVLRILRGRHPEPATVNYVRERMIDKNCDASRIIERLRVKKLLDRKENKTDRRAVDIFISSKGQGLLFAIDNEIHNLESTFSRLSDAELQTLNDLLDKLRG